MNESYKNVHGNMYPGRWWRQSRTPCGEADYTKIYVNGKGWVYLNANIDSRSKETNGYLFSMISGTSQMIEAVGV